jgi:hypothetical protein
LKLHQPLHRHTWRLQRLPRFQPPGVTFSGGAKTATDHKLM